MITVKQPTPDFIFPLATPYTTVHGPELVDSGEIGLTAIGTGPMILDHWTSGVGGAFDKNPDYFRKEVKIDRWELPFVLDLGAAEAQFRVGRHDYGISAATSDDLEKILETNPDTQYFGNPLFASTFALNFNLDLPKWQDERIRRGLSLAYDRDEMLAIMYSGAGVILPQMDWRYFWEEEPSPDTGVLGNWWRYDPDEAREAARRGGRERPRVPDDVLQLQQRLEQPAERGAPRPVPPHRRHDPAEQRRLHRVQLAVDHAQRRDGHVRRLGPRSVPPPTTSSTG